MLPFIRETVGQIAEGMFLSVKTVEKDVRMAGAWLRAEPR